ncbi:fatty acid synthase-like [Spodoptera litura]|uniref:Fatty acid synthase-like n=1 Tax=Spodoptera litura TaxID=69820 RepID=A0A9J7EEB8_SPOLT|nr:fatty acid synthase-like [Spodoptera litura]
MPPTEDFGAKDVKDVPSLSGDEVVISGISGVFPNSDSVLDFMNNLYNKVDMVTEEPKWNVNNPDIPKHAGKITGTDKFDAQFFGVSYHLACALEPMARKLLEHAYGAIFDSGTNPQSLRGKRVGVFVGVNFTDNSTLSMYNVNKRTDFVINGCSKAMLANRISYWIDSKGPSYGLDYACSGSTACLEIAYKSIKSGECDAAIIGGCNFGLHPTLAANLRRAGLLCLDGKTKCFDKNGDGYVRADAINVIFLQKAKDAHRIYTQVYHAKGIYKMRPDAQFLPYRESEDIEKFLNEFYKETDVDPKRIEYVEAHAAAIAKADENELRAIGNIFAKENSVKVGSVKSNMGNSESASGICALTKLCLAYHQGKLPANLHYNDPQDNVPAVKDGRIQVVTDNADFNRGFTAMNNFSFSGANFHVLLKGLYKEKNLQKYECQIPRLVLASGREETCVHKIIDILKSHPIDAEEISLLHKIFEYDIPGHTGRGYTILDTNENQETVSIAESADYYPGLKRPLWFVYSGMGSQWAGMGADLMRIPIFANAIHKCHKVLEPLGLNLIRIVTEPDNSIFDNILNAFVGIGAIQIGLTDVIKAMGIVPDYIIGHSLGEMACAYHDNTFTAEELILATYSRGKVCLETDLIKGSMAAVGVGYQAIVNQCPPEIDIACHNSHESSTISGPADKMTEFVGELTKRGIFAKEVPCANIAYHSRYIAQCGPELLRRLREVIKSPKKRSSKWISTSVPQDRWDQHEAVYSSAEYHTNNLLKPVLFEETSKMIPDNAIVVEIAPHGLLQAILKRSHKECTHIPLTRRGNTNGVKFLLEAVGKLYEAGVNPRVDVLYPKIEFPVSTETPLLSHFVAWEHSEDWPQMSFLEKDEVRTAMERKVILSTHDDDYNFLEGHLRNGANVLPESAILVLVWETLAMHIGVSYRDQPVVYRDIHFHSEIVLKLETPLRLTVAINRGSNKFEVSQNDIRIASGIVSGVKVVKYNQDPEIMANDEKEIILNSEDVYNIFRSRGYSYRDQFKSIESSTLDHKKAFVQWSGEWVTFLDSLIQLTTLSRNHEGISTPKFIRKIRISILEQQISNSVEVNGTKCFPAQYDEVQGVIRCAGVELDNVTFVDKPVINQYPGVLLTKSFYPHYAMDQVDMKTALQIMLQIVAENTTMKRIKATQIVTSNTNIICIIKGISTLIPNVMIDVASIINVNIDFDTLLVQNSDADKANVFIFEDLFGNKKKLDCLKNISNDSFIIALECGVPALQSLNENFTIISSMSDGKQILILLKRRNPKDVTYMPVNCDNKLDWVSRVYNELNKTKRVMLVSERQPYCGALGFVNKLKSDGEDKIGLIAIDDCHAPTFDPNIGIYKHQLNKNLTVNIFRKGQWGGYYYTSATKSTSLRDVALVSPNGDLENLTWVEAPNTITKHKLVKVTYSGISSKDVQKAVSNLGDDLIPLGMDFSGTNADGDRVMGLVAGGALSTTVEADSDLLWPVPEYWSLQDAATVPLPYAVAYYCLAIKSRLFKGQSVFVTGGAGALGQAVIAVCLSLECFVFTTVSSMKKKSMLLQLFPGLDEKNIGYSRDDSFLSMIKMYAPNKGCDIVINCASGYIRETAMKCTGNMGFFLDLSAYDMIENKDIGMSYLEKDRSYKAVNFSSIFRPENAAEKKILQRMLAEGIANGTVRPISRIEYTPTQISRAFRLVSSSKHIGKVIIKMSSPEVVKGFDVVPSMNYNSNGVYIVVCDDNGIGIELADRLVKRGARKIVLNTRTKVRGYWHSKFISWEKQKVTIKISTENLESQQGCTKMLKEASRIGFIRGIFIVPDIEDKNDEKPLDFVRTFNKATFSVINLDLTSKNYCNELSHFVVLLPPSYGTSNEYSYSLLERICQMRSENGLPALIVRMDALTVGDSKTILEPQKLMAFFNGMENSLKLKYNNVLTLGLNEENVVDYEMKLAKIFGVPKIEALPEHFTIGDLLLTKDNLIELQTLIRNTHKVDYPVEKIVNITVGSLKNIKNQNSAEPKNYKGLGAFYTCVDNEEEHLSTSHPIVPMVTLLNNGTETDLDPQETYLTLIPGFEGRYQIFSGLAERLKVQAVAVQLIADIEGNSIEEMAATVRKFMKTKFESKSKFYLLGYSFGVNIALEVAAILEKEGHTGVVYCLDSSPDALRIQLNSYLGEISDTELQNSILEHISQLIAGKVPEELGQYLEQINDWPTKVDACLYTLRGIGNYSKQYKGSLLDFAYRNILFAKNYEPKLKLNSEIVLIKGKPELQSQSLSADYNLTKYTKNPVKVYHIDSDHPSAPYDSRVTNIVNKLLDENSLKEFKHKNLCDKYIIQPK